MMSNPETMAVVVLDRKLPHAVGMGRDLLDDLDSTFTIDRQDFVRVLDPNETAGRLNLPYLANEKDLRPAMLDGAVFLLPDPCDVETKHVSIVGLGRSNVGDGQLRRYEMPIRSVRGRAQGRLHLNHLPASESSPVVLRIAFDRRF